MSNEIQKAYAVQVTVYLTANDDLDAVQKSIEINDMIKELTGNGAYTHRIKEIDKTNKGRPVDLVENVNRILADN